MPISLKSVLLCISSAADRYTSTISISQALCSLFFWSLFVLTCSIISLSVTLKAQKNCIHQYESCYTNKGFWPPLGAETLINNKTEWGQQGAVPSINSGFLCRIQKIFQPPKHCTHMTCPIIKVKVRKRETPILLGQPEVQFLPMPDEFWNSFINIRKNWIIYHQREHLHWV